MCGIQTDEGYFAETIGPGPAVTYHQVSLHGLADYYAVSGDQTVLPAIRRGIRFIERASYPDVTPTRALDERNREGRRPGQVGGGTGLYGLAFGYTPAGRRFAQITLDRIAEAQKKRPESIGWYAASIIALATTGNGGIHKKPTDGMNICFKMTIAVRKSGARKKTQAMKKH